MSYSVAVCTDDITLFNLFEKTMLAVLLLVESNFFLSWIAVVKIHAYWRENPLTIHTGDRFNGVQPFRLFFFMRASQFVLTITTLRLQIVRCFGMIAKTTKRLLYATFATRLFHTRPLNGRKGTPNLRSRVNLSAK